MKYCENNDSKTLTFFGTDDKKSILGDVILGLESIENESVDLIFADPPYNIGKNFNGYWDKWKNEEDYLQWCYKWIDLCIRKIKPNGCFYVMTSTQFMPFLDIYLLFLD